MGAGARGARGLGWGRGGGGAQGEALGLGEGPRWLRSAAPPGASSPGEGWGAGHPQRSRLVCPTSSAKSPQVEPLGPGQFRV